MAITGFEHMSPYELGETGSAEAIPYLIRYLKIGSSSEKRLAASAIRKLTPKHMDSCERTVPLLINCLNDAEFPLTRQYILKALLLFQIPQESLPVIQKVFNSDEKEYNRILAEKIISKTKTRPLNPQERFSKNRKELVPLNILNTDSHKIDWHYDDSGYYSYILLSKLDSQINQDDIQYVTKKLTEIGVINILSGRSYRPANNGRQYQWYIRVSEESGTSPSRQKVETLLREITKAPYDVGFAQQTQVYIRQLQESIKREQQEKESIKTQLRDTQSLYSEAEGRAAQYKREAAFHKEASKQEALKFQEDIASLLTEISSTQTELEQSLRKNEDVQLRIEEINHDRQNTLARLEEAKALSDGAREEYSIFERVLSEEKKDLENRIGKLEKDIQLACNQRDIAKAETEYIQNELYEIQDKCDLLQRQLSCTSTPALSLADDFKKFLECLLPNLEICEESVYFLIEIKNYTKVLTELESLNANPSLVESKRVEVANGWLEISHVHIGDSDNGRIYYAKSRSTNKYLVLVSHKHTQKRDFHKLRKWKV